MPISNQYSQADLEAVDTAMQYKPVAEPVKQTSASLTDDQYETIKKMVQTGHEKVKALKPEIMELYSARAINDFRGKYQTELESSPIKNTKNMRRLDDLYLGINADDPAIAEQATATWEKLNPQVKQSYEKLIGMGYQPGTLPSMESVKEQSLWGKTKDFVKKVVIGEKEGYQEIPSYLHDMADFEYTNDPQKVISTFHNMAKGKTGAFLSTYADSKESYKGFGSNVAAVVKGAGAFLSTPQVPSMYPQRDDIRKSLASAYYKGVDKFGNHLYDFKIPMPGKFKGPYYIDKPGVSPSDMADFSRALKEAPITAAFPGQGLLALAAKEALVAGGHSVIRQVQSDVASGEGLRDAGQLGVQAGTEAVTGATFSLGTSVLGDVVVPALGAVGKHTLKQLENAGVPAQEVVQSMYGAAKGHVRDAVEKLVINADYATRNMPVLDPVSSATDNIRFDPTPPPKLESFFDAENNLTPEGAQWLDANNISYEDVLSMAKFGLTDKLKTVGNERFAMELDEQFNYAVTSMFNQNPMLTDMITGKDPQAQLITDIGERLMSMSDRLGIAAKQSINNDAYALLRRLKDIAGSPTDSIIDRSLELDKTVKGLYKQIDESAKKMYDEAFESGGKDAMLDLEAVAQVYRTLRDEFPDAKYAGDIAKLERELVRYGVIDAPKMTEALEARKRSIDTKYDLTIDKLKVAAERKKLQAATKSVADDIRLEVAEHQKTINIARQEEDEVFRKSVGAREKEIVAERFKSGEALTEELTYINEQLDRFIDDAAYMAEVKTKRLPEDIQNIKNKNEKLVAVKSWQDNQVLELRLKDLERLRSMEKNITAEMSQFKMDQSRLFDDFTVEAAAGLDRSLGGIKLSELPVGSLMRVKNAIREGLANSPADFGTKYLQAVQGYKDFKGKFDKSSILHDLSARAFNGTSSFSEIAADGIPKRIASMSYDDVVHIKKVVSDINALPSTPENDLQKSLAKNSLNLMRSITQSEILEALAGSIGTSMKTLSQGRISNRSVVAVRREALDSAIKAQGGWDKLEVLLPKDQLNALRMLHLHLQSSIRRPLTSANSTEMDSASRRLMKNITGNVWLSFRSPVAAGGIAGYKTTMYAKDLASTTKARNYQLNGLEFMQDRAKQIAKDHLRYKARREMGSDELFKQNLEQLKRDKGLDALKFKDMTMEQQQVFLDGIRDRYKNLAAFMDREINTELMKAPFRAALVESNVEHKKDKENGGQ